MILREHFDNKTLPFLDYIPIIDLNFEQKMFSNKCLIMVGDQLQQMSLPKMKEINQDKSLTKLKKNYLAIGQNVY